MEKMNTGIKILRHNTNTISKMIHYGGVFMKETELQKAWKNSILTVAQELGIIKFLNWIINNSSKI